MTCGWHKIHARMDSGVRDFPLAVDEDLFSQVSLVLIIDVFNDWLPARGKGKR